MACIHLEEQNLFAEGKTEARKCVWIVFGESESLCLSFLFRDGISLSLSLVSAIPAQLSPKLPVGNIMKRKEMNKQTSFCAEFVRGRSIRRWSDSLHILFLFCFFGLKLDVCFLLCWANAQSLTFLLYHVVDEMQSRYLLFVSVLTGLFWWNVYYSDANKATGCQATICRG